MADINKAIKPIESARIAPLNDGTIYQANKEIVFRLGAGLLYIFLRTGGEKIISLVTISRVLEN